MSANPNYLASPSYSAIQDAIQIKVDSGWQSQITTFHPILASIFDMGHNWNKSLIQMAGSTKVRGAILYDELAHLTPETAGLAGSEMLPRDLMQYPDIEGYTHAEFEMAYLQTKFAMTPKEQMIANGARGNLLDAKIQTITEAFKRILSQSLASDRAQSEKYVGGLDHVLSTSNTVGGISQASRAWWRANVRTGTNALTASHIDNDYDAITGIRGQEPDLLLATQNTTMNVYRRIADFIQTPLRLTVAPDANKGLARYGYKSFEWNGMSVVADTKGTTGTYRMLTTNTWHVKGSKSPKALEPKRIQESESMGYLFSMWFCLACLEPRQNLRRAGITS